MFSATYVRQCPVKLGSTFFFFFFFFFFFYPKQGLWILTINVLSNELKNIKTFLLKISISAAKKIIAICILVSIRYVNLRLNLRNQHDILCM